MNRTLTKKLIYVVAALTLLAMLIPAMAVPASAAGETLTMTIFDGTNWVSDQIASGPYAGEGFNASGSVVKIHANFTPTGWNLQNVTTVPPYGPATWYTPTLAPTTETDVYVTGVWGEARITATFNGGSVGITKKWGMIDHTTFVTPATQTKYVTWNEGTKSFSATGNVTDSVYGDFVVSGQHVIMPVQGVKFNWYLVSGDVAVSMNPGLPVNLNSYVNGLAKAQFVQFLNKSAAGYSQWNHTGPGWIGTSTSNYSGTNGQALVDIGAWFEEVVQIVVVPEYPTDPNRFVVPEVTSFNFGTYEYESVPQVRWAGEKIVLEANFGLGYAGDQVEFFFQNQGVGTLEGLDNDSDAQEVWTTVAANGIASAILTSNVSGVADVVAALYANGSDRPATNQHSFRVYFLNFYSLTLRDVNGKRAAHNDGDWTPENPYSNNFPGVASSDMLTQTGNVSQDLLERAQIRGWFMPAGAQKSSRPEINIDLDADGSVLADHDMGDVVAPAGHYVLPDDWMYLMGSDPLRRLHWDIMDSPGDTVKSVAALGPYYKGTTANYVAEAPVVGPFAPGIEVMTPNGWMYNNPTVDHTAVGNPAKYPREINTVVPNGEVNAWDAPMPPAKVVFEIMSGAGYFKDAWKTGIYYTGTGTSKLFTAPFYQALIPAHWAIPPFNNEFGGGYDWNSFDGVHGNYEFWKIINQPTNNTYTPGDAMHPTRVEVYSDNHGEAMAYLNGNWNLNLTRFGSKGGADIMNGDVVANSVVRALADYPYIRTEPLILSNTVAKTWTWGGRILGADNTLHEFPDTPTNTMATELTRMVLTAGTWTKTGGTAPNEYGTSTNKMAFIWATDRDGLRFGVEGAKVTWTISGDGSVRISGRNTYGGGISNYNTITQSIQLVNGFLDNTNGALSGGMDGRQAVSYMRQPTQAEKDLFNKFWGTSGTAPIAGANPANYVIAGIDVAQYGGPIDVNVTAVISSCDFGLTPGVLGEVEYKTNVDFAKADPMDDAPIYGDSNMDGKVNMGDVTVIERIILGLNASNTNADANGNGTVDMGDVVKVERKILGY